MTYREAKIEDIGPIRKVRSSVAENIMSNPESITNGEIEKFLFELGKGWVCEVENRIVGFAIIDLKNSYVWALFLEPSHEKKGIGKELHRIMLDWYFDKSKEDLWLSSDPNTRAEGFYRKQGWIENGKYKDEIRFEMTRSNWLKSRAMQTSK